MNQQNALRKGWLRLLKHTLNPLTRRLARSSIGPFSIIRHRGRRSGTWYETPIIVSRVRDGFVIELTYGHDVDWHKNMVAANSGIVIWQRREYTINAIEPLDTAAGMAAFPPYQRRVLRLLGRTHFEKLRAQEQHATSSGRA